MIGYYDRDGKPITLEQYVLLFERRGADDYRRVAQDTIGDVLISTVWLGIDHGFGLGDGPPLIFETMIFPGGDCSGEYCERTSTEAAALAAHDQAVEHVRSGAYAAECRNAEKKD